MTLETKKTLDDFDVRSWRGLAALLAYVRKQNLAPEEYAIFRDDVTAYSQSGGTNAEIYARIGKVLVGTSTIDATIPIVSVAETPVAVGAQTASVNEGADIAADTVFVKVIQEALPVVVEKKMPVATQAPMPLRIPESLPDTDPDPQKILSLDEARARILFIKHDLHEMVGNPLSLVGQHKVLGKEYMQTLLEASRATMGGAGGGMLSAMRKLEDVYGRLKLAVMSAGDASSSHEEQATSSNDVEINDDDVVLPAAIISEKIELEPEPLPEPEPEQEPMAIKEPEPEPELEPKPGAEPEIESEPEPEIRKWPEPVVFTKPEPIDEPEPKSELETEPEFISEPICEHESGMEIEDEPVPEPQPQHESEPELEQKVAIAVIVAQDKTIDVLRARLKELEDLLEVQKKQAEEKPPTPKLTKKASSETEKTPEPEPISTPKPVSVSESKQDPELVAVKEKKQQSTQVLHSPEKTTKPSVPRSSMAQSLKTVVSPHGSIMENEIMRDDVTNGLADLLSEWEIFRRGFFNHNERGITHPLYLNIKDLPMSYVMAGRFEGAQTSIVISINDYVNAWRFEQAIDYLPIETFEHYLRRVIYKIIVRTRK